MLFQRECGRTFCRREKQKWWFPASPHGLANHPFLIRSSDFCAAGYRRHVQALPLKKATTIKICVIYGAEQLFRPQFWISAIDRAIFDLIVAQNHLSPFH
jgi:hypothetical protein